MSRRGALLTLGSAWVASLCLPGASHASADWPALGSTQPSPRLELSTPYPLGVFLPPGTAFEDADLMSGFQLEPKVASPGSIAALGQQTLPPPPMLVTTTRIGGALAGFWAAALAHEAGHAVTAWAMGTPFEWPRALVGGNLFLPAWSVRLPEDSAEGRRQKAFIGAAGLGSSMLLSEALFLSKSFPKNDTFTAGFLFYDIANAVGYTVADLVVRANGNPEGFGDIRDMTQGGYNRNIIYGVLLTKAAVNLVRLVQNKQLQKLRYWRSVDPPDDLSFDSR